VLGTGRSARRRPMRSAHSSGVFIDGISDRAALRVAGPTPHGAATLPDDIDRAPHRDEQQRQVTQQLRAGSQDPQRSRIVLVVSRIGDDVHPESTVIGNGLVHPAVERGHQWLQVRAFTARTKADAGLIPGWRHRLETVHPEVHPHAVESFLDGGGDAGLARPWRAVQQDDLAWFDDGCVLGMRLVTPVQDRELRRPQAVATSPPADVKLGGRETLPSLVSRAAVFDAFCGHVRPAHGRG